MTLYAAATTQTFTGTVGSTFDIALAISPGSYEVRMTRIEVAFVEMSTTNPNVTSPTAWSYKNQLRRRVGGSASGGTAFTPTPLRQGAVASSSTARFGTLSLTGTDVFVASAGLLGWATGDPVALTYETPFDLTFSPGSPFIFTMFITVTGGGTLTITPAVTCFFEELRLSWPY